MPQPQGPELDVTFGQGALVKCAGAGHYKVGRALIESGLLVPDGFQSTDSGTAMIIVCEGVSPTDAIVFMTAKIKELVASGEIWLDA